MVASLVDALPLPCRFSDGTFAAVVAGYRCAELCCYHCASFFPVDTWPPWFLSSGCFATTIVSLFRQILGHCGCSLADALPLQLRVSFRADTWPLWFRSIGCFATVVILASLADAWPPSRLVLFLADTLPPLLLEARLVAITVSLHCRLPLCCCDSVIGLVYYGLEAKGPPSHFLLPLVCTFSDCTGNPLITCEPCATCNTLLLLNEKRASTSACYPRGFLIYNAGDHQIYLHRRFT